MSVFPFISPEILTENAPEALPLFREYAYDMENNRLLLRGGKTYLVEGNRALEIWIYKTLFTERFRYIAYDADYGSELDTLIGCPPNDDVVQSEIKRMIIEALMVNPYIEELSNFKFTAGDCSLRVDFDCATVYGIMPVGKEVLTG